ncbi:MAG TPA: hypothetical protein VKK31_09020 [Thermoanaerobaculia bacterium]|nr:hypothetical protein [Thermoanaerobaculia bacterium]
MSEDPSREQEEVRKVLKALEKKDSNGVPAIARTVSPLARIKALLEWSWRLRHEDPPQMVQFALYATLVADELDARRYGVAQIFDIQARAYAELGNAYRVQDRHYDSAKALGRARELFERGARDRTLETRLLELEGSLAADRRQFGRASEKLLRVLEFYEQQGDFHLAGRTLVKIGLYAGYAGDHEKGIALLKKSLALVDEERDPSLACAAAHNLILLFLDTGRFWEAKKVRLLYSRHLAEARGRVNEIKFRALDGLIDAGLGNHVRAEAIFREVREGFEEVGRHYHAAIAGLDLTAALLAQGKSEDATITAFEAEEVFIGLQIQREALQAVILLRDAFRAQTATLEMVQEVAGFLRRLEIEPALRFEGRAWEDPDR